ncbi:ABC transporter substrate-binding protein [Salinadaptatus halalkaliphilus]|uniref:ABC transporter substrate-binding protein n=1 Tax=Salinadaptatus halalkaliphilus TaxID=2419781 RepID=A0A4S3TLL2_9EURY|nr:ABC transporter substrate-binding protein [Salinadaptatus halalkaliphilus]THE63875.1 ABC transporter substrate-binding protein [Salinadaptatus halalkaliphilus]
MTRSVGADDSTVTDNLSRRSFLAAGGAGAATALAGCSDGEEIDAGNGADEDTDVDGDYLRMAVDSVSSLDPVIIQLDSVGEYNIYERLTDHRNGQLPAEGNLAEDWRTEDDGRIYEFDLKEGVQYHDGREMTADDVVYAWRRMAESPETRNADDLLDTFEIAHERDDDGELVPDSLAVEAVDDYTVRVELAQPFYLTLDQLANISFAVYPAGVVGDIEGYDGEMSQSEFGTENPIGSGPFQLEEWEDGSHLSIERFDEYHGEVADIDGVHWSIMDDSNARLNRALNRNLDVFTMEPSQFDPDLLEIEETDEQGREFGTYGPLDNDEMVQYQSSEVLVSYYIVFNTANVDELAVRRAIGHVIDQHELAANEFNDMYDPGYHIVPPSAFPGGEDNYWEMAESDYPYGYAESQIDEARELMEDAGYGEDDMYELSLTVYPDSIWQDFGELLASQARAAHIDIDVQEAPQSTIINQAIEGTMDAFTLWDRMDYPGPDVFHRFLHPTPEMPQFTRISAGVDSEYADEAADAWEQYLDNRGPSDAEEQARNEAFERIETANLEMVAQLPLLHERVHRFVYDWVDIDMHGAMEYQQYNTVSIDDQP